MREALRVLRRGVQHYSSSDQVAELYFKHRQITLL